MSKCYLVPEEGLKVALAAVEAGITERRGLFPREAGRVALEAFIRWQSENPPVMNVTQQNAMPNCSLAEFCAEWVRRMYLAPKPSIPNHLIQAFMGITLTQSQAKSVIELVNQCTRKERADE